jgi:hypothetical protein
MNEAIRYLRIWGESFWQETEFRIKEVTKKLEDSLNAEFSAGLGVPGAKLTAGVKGDLKLSEEQKAELVQRGQTVVAQAQIEDLHKVIELLDTVLDNRQKKYFVIIDALDQNWVEERLRYRLIMALIETVGEFIQVRNAKIIIALRRDLIDRVFRLARQAGFQEEKYQSLYLQLNWKSEDLIAILDRRVQALVSRRYAKQVLTHQDVLPKQYRRTHITEYIGQIATRPRDVISFFNCCINAATNGKALPELRKQSLAGAAPDLSQAYGNFPEA